MKIYIFGLGAIGSNLIIQLIKQFPENEYYGIDYDKIEDRNIKTQAYFLEQVGMPKVLAIPIIAQRFVRKFSYRPINKKLERIDDILEFMKADDFTKDSLILDCFDNAKARSIFEKCKEPVKILHIGFSPQYTAEVMWHEAYDVPNDVDPNAADICEMEEATSFIHFVVNFAVMNITAYFNEGKKYNYIITNKMKIQKI